MSAPDDLRDALELSSDENADLCSGCSRCCETVSIEIDKPRTSQEYDQWIWVLHHRDLEIYVESPEQWYLHITTRCNHLTDDRRCRVYHERPRLCREYDPRSCERRLPLSDIVAWFRDGAEFEAWLEATRPAHYKRLMAWRKDDREATCARPKGRARRVQIAEALVQIRDPRRYSVVVDESRVPTRTRTRRATRA